MHEYETKERLIDGWDECNQDLGGAEEDLGLLLALESIWDWDLLYMYYRDETTLMRRTPSTGLGEKSRILKLISGWCRSVIA